MKGSTKNNWAYELDESGVLTIKIDTNQTLEKAGTQTQKGTARKNDLVSSTRGSLLLGNVTINMNVMRQ